VAWSSSDLPAARRLVRALDGLGGGPEGTLTLGRAMTPAQWEQAAVHLAGMAAPTIPVIEAALGMLTDRVGCALAWDRLTHGNFPHRRPA